MATKQYVNLLYDADKHHGAKVVLEATAANVGGDDVVRSEWWVEPGADNTDLKYLSRWSRGRMRRKYVRNRDDKFKNTLKLPHIGGDKYTVNCSKRGDRSSPVTFDEIETWRRIYYTVHYMKADNPGDRDGKAMFDAVSAKFEAAFTEAFIEMELKEKKETLRREDHTAYKTVKGLFWTKRRRGGYIKTPRLSDRPFHLRIVVLRNIYEPKNNSYTRNFTGTVEAGWTMDLGRPPTPTRWLRSAKARVRRRLGWRNIKSLVTIDHGKTIKINFAGNDRLNRALTDGRTVQVKIRTRERSEFEGFSIGNLCVVRICNPRKTEEEMKVCILQTFTHEVGHGFQQAVRRERTYHTRLGTIRRRENNPRWHTNRHGGQGPHCWKNAKLVADTRARRYRTRSGRIYTWDSGTLCTMFFRDDSHGDQDGKFCEEYCRPRLIRVKLSKGKMRGQGWNSY